MKRIGIIDVGSNSARLVIMEISSQKGATSSITRKILCVWRLRPIPRDI